MKGRGYTILDWLVALGLGALFFAGSATHVYEMAIANRQGHYGALSVVGSMEILAAYAGLEAKRRASWGRVVPLGVLLGAVLFVVATNLASADAVESVTWARIIAVTPALAFFALVLIFETRGWKRPGRARKVIQVKQSEPVVPAVEASTPPAKPHVVRDASGRKDALHRRWLADPAATSTAVVASELGVSLRAAQVLVKRWRQDAAA